MRSLRSSLVLLLVVSLTASLFVAVPAVPVVADEDSDASAVEGVVYEYWGGETYHDNVTGWIRYDPADGAPHPYNQLEENEWFIPESNRNDPQPYGSRTQVRQTSLLHEFYQPENASWVIFDPNGSPHSDNSVNGTLTDGCPEYAKDWASPWWASTRTRDRNPLDTTPVDSGGSDPFGDLVKTNLKLADSWWFSIWNWFVHVIGRDDLHGQAMSLSDAYDDFFDADKQP
jgi:hypothetical protein